MAQEIKKKEPQYILITDETRMNNCPVHTRERLVHLYNNKNWVMTVTAIDKIQFACSVCGNVRVYQLKKERELL